MSETTYENYKAYATMYNSGHNRLQESNMFLPAYNPSLSDEHDIKGLENISLISQIATSIERCQPCIYLEKVDPIHIGEGFHLEFDIVQTLFGNNNGYNGGVSFLWYGNSTGAKMCNNNTAPLPENSAVFNYDPDNIEGMGLFSGSGLFSKMTSNTNNYGICLTLLPDKDGADVNTSKVSHYVIGIMNKGRTSSTVKPYRVIHGNLASSINLMEYTTLALNVNYGNINIFVNGKHIAEIPLKGKTENGDDEGDYLENLFDDYTEITNRMSLNFACAVMGNSKTSESYTTLNIHNMRYIPKWENEKEE